LSASGDQQHFGDGIAEEILDELTGLDGLRVAARASSFAYREKAADLREIAEALNVTAILDGSIRRSGDRVRIASQLVNASNGYQLWSETYERELTDLFEIQDDIASAVAGALGVTLGVGDINAYRGAGTTSIEAYEAFLRARGAAANPMMRGNAEEAISLLKRAVALDPDYAAAFALLGLTIASTMWQNMPEEAPGIIDEAVGYLLQAVELEPDSAYAYALLGTVNYARMDWIQSEAYFQKSLAASSDPEARGHYSNMLMRSGRSRAAIATLESLNLPVNRISASAHIAIEDYDTVRAPSAAFIGPSRARIDYLVALNEGDLETVALALSQLPQQGPSWENMIEPILRDPTDTAAIGLALRSTLNNTQLRWPEKYNDLALLAAFFNHPQLAMDALGRESRLTTLRLYTLWYPVFREVRQLEDFKALLTDINLTGYWRAHGWPDHCYPIGAEDFACS
ncbi:MAG: hypothetical protein AAGE43_07395, partial [Pseudomonadota bacterium]